MGNIFHFVIIDSERIETELIEEKVAYICKQYPNLIYERNEEGNTPLNYSLYFLKLQCILSLELEI